MNGRYGRLYHDIVFDSLSGAEILTIAVVALVVFGPGRLPDIARTIGRYVRELRSAVSDLRHGIEQEVGPIREPMKEIKQELSQPVADVRRTFTETAETAKAAEKEVRKAAKAPAPKPSAAKPSAADAAAIAAAGAAAAGAEQTPEPAADSPSGAGIVEDGGPAAEETPGVRAEAAENSEELPEARWIAPEPSIGVSPGEAREGMEDPMPETVHPPPEHPPDDAEDEPGEAEEVRTDDRAAGA